MDVKHSKTFLSEDSIVVNKEYGPLGNQCLYEKERKRERREEDFNFYYSFQKYIRLNFLYLKVEHEWPSSFSLISLLSVFLLSLFSIQPILQSFACFMFSKAQICRCLSPDSRYLTVLTWWKILLKSTLYSSFQSCSQHSCLYAYMPLPVSINAVIFCICTFVSLFFFFSSWVMSRYLSNSKSLKVYP